MEQKSFYITTTLPYVNAPLHMGHALEFVRADAYARYKKLLGFDVYFNTGTDEHGVKIYTKALEQGLDPQEFVDRGFATFQEQLQSFGVTDDIHFIRTTDAKHIRIAQDFWRRVRDNGFLYKKTYHAKYCVGCESEKTDSELDEQGCCPLHPGIELQLLNEENYFFKYSAFGEKILEMYTQNSSFIIPDFRYNEMKEFVKRGLQDFSVSRVVEKMPWGIPVPEDDTQVMYVWFDALTNYISTFADDSVQSFDDLIASENFQKYWVNGNPTQYCGKDNTRFQGIMWQAMLFAAGIPCSKQVVTNGFVMGGGGIRMSKTLGNVVDPRDIVETFGTDALRYFLLREISSFEDSPFTQERFCDAYNAGLANGLGNLTARILTLSEKYLTDVVIDNSIIPDMYHTHMEQFDLQKTMELIWVEIGVLDKYINDEKPFSVIKTDEEKGKLLIQHCVQKLDTIATMLVPFLPETAEKILFHIAQNKKPEISLFNRIEK